ncbi:probable membrane-associated kinase regulator 6 [Capsella rubella]|nr:probable membrane-associated kinase regulator 6 [Capsella rubella]
MEEDKQEASMPLVPIDSFSYSWLVNFPSLDDHHHQTYEDSSSSSSFIEMDPRLPPSRRFIIKTSHESSFKFDSFVSFSDEDHSSLVHADELFRDGYVVPYRLKATSSSAATEEESEPLDTTTTTTTGKIETRGVKSKSSCRKLRRVSKWVLLKYLDFLTPLCRRLRRCRSAGPNIGMDSRIRVTTSSRSRVYSSDETTSSPRISVADDYNWRRSCDSESSIYEAVLHCKKSFER